jgi:hypothetical protein
VKNEGFVTASMWSASFLSKLFTVSLGVVVADCQSIWFTYISCGFICVSRAYLRSISCSFFLFRCNHLVNIIAPKAASSLFGIVSFLGITRSKYEALSFVAITSASTIPPRVIPSTDTEFFRSSSLCIVSINAAANIFAAAILSRNLN